MNTLQAALIALVVVWALVAGAYHMGKRSAFQQAAEARAETIQNDREKDDEVKALDDAGLLERASRWLSDDN